MALPRSGTYYIDGLLYGQNLTGAVGTAAKASVNATLALAPFRSLEIEKFFDSPEALSGSEQALIRSVLACYENIANISFNYTADASAQIFVRKGAGDKAYGYTELRFSGQDPVKSESADVIFEEHEFSSAVKGSFFYTVMLHELGHSLGLKHPHDNGQGDFPLLPESEDSFAYTVMSYNTPHTANGGKASDILPVGPMLYDVAALQYLYGRNMTYHSGDDVYVLDGLKSLDGIDHTQALPEPFRFAGEALWDAGGRDVIDASGASGDASIDLTPGAGHAVYAGRVVWNIAYGARIEDAIGGPGDDVILGNGLDNVIRGGAGDDVLDGGIGTDEVSYVDVLSSVKINLAGGYAEGFESGSDSLFFMENATGGLGNDFIYGNEGANVLRGGAGADVLEGGEGDDELHGDDDADRISGGAGNDFMDGGAGEDVADYTKSAAGVKVILSGFSAEGADTGVDHLQGFESVYGGGGDDELNGDEAPNRFFGFGGKDIIHGGGADDLLFGGGGNDQIFGDGGGDVLYGGFGADTLTGGDAPDVFFFSAEETTPAAYDTVTDFQPGVDKIFIYGKSLDFGFDDLVISVTSGTTLVQSLDHLFKVVLTGEFELHESDFLFG